MMGVVFIAIEGARRAGLGGLEEPIVTDEADAFKDWSVRTLSSCFFTSQLVNSAQSPDSRRGDIGR